MTMLTNLYTAIATATVTVGGTPIAGTVLSAVREYLPSAHFPCRLMLAHPRGGGNDRLSFTFGNDGTTESSYQVVDLFLYKAVIEGEGMVEAQVPLVEYRENYSAMAIALRASLADCYIAQSVDLNTGMQLWDGVYYHGVEAVWTVSILQ